MDKGRRRWEDLDRDYLVNAFVRVGMELLFFDVPFVCKTWFTETLDPSCWQHLIFPVIPSEFANLLNKTKNSFTSLCDSMELYPDHFDPLIRRCIGAYRFRSSHLSITALLSCPSSEARSNGNVMFLKVPQSKSCSEVVAYACPGLKALALPRNVLNSGIIPELVSNLASLRSLLLLGKCNHIEEILLPISILFAHIIRDICFSLISGVQVCYWHRVSTDVSKRHIRHYLTRHQLLTEISISYELMFINYCVVMADSKSLEPTLQISVIGS